MSTKEMKYIYQYLQFLLVWIILIWFSPKQYENFFVKGGFLVKMDVSLSGKWFYEDGDHWDKPESQGIVDRGNNSNGRQLHSNSQVRGGLTKMMGFQSNPKIGDFKCFVSEWTYPLMRPTWLFKVEFSKGIFMSF